MLKKQCGGNKYRQDGFVQPFFVSPIGIDKPGKGVYLQLINNAQKYIYITTPYLILDEETVTALVLAAQRGVDVRIITPYKADKWYVHFLSQAYYKQFIRGGIRIYEYKPGFIHSKMVACDDDIAMVGSINLDFRSFYLHYECASVFYYSSLVKKVVSDIEHTFDSCIEIDENTLAKTGKIKAFVQSVLRIFAPIL